MRWGSASSGGEPSVRGLATSASPCWPRQAARRRRGVTAGFVRGLGTSARVRRRRGGVATVVRDTRRALRRSVTALGDSESRRRDISRRVAASTIAGSSAKLSASSSTRSGSAQASSARSRGSHASAMNFASGDCGGSTLKTSSSTGCRLPHSRSIHGLRLSEGCPPHRSNLAGPQLSAEAARRLHMLLLPSLSFRNVRAVHFKLECAAHVRLSNH